MKIVLCYFITISYNILQDLMMVMLMMMVVMMIDINEVVLATKNMISNKILSIMRIV